jgi:hypothetical protein
MKPTHRYDTKAYPDYYIHQAGKGYPVFAGRRYQRGHAYATLVCVGGTSNKSSSDFVHSYELGCTSAILIRNVIRCVPLLGLPDVWSFFVWQVLYNSLSWGSYKEDMDLAVSLKDSLKQPCLC